MKFSIRIFLWTAILFISSETYGQLTVTNANDSGAGSLRQAVIDANTNIGADQIVFDPSLAGMIINLDAVIIITSGNGDGTTIDGDIDGDEVPDITLQPSGVNYSGIEIQAANCTISHLHLQGFLSAGRAAILINGTTATGNGIYANYLGTDISGNASGTTNHSAIYINGGATGTLIGDGTSSGLNVISGNTFGIRIANASNNTTISGNYIGIGLDGSTAIDNSRGIDLFSIDGVNIGIPGDLPNVIGTTGGTGIYMSASLNAVILGNYIGVDASGVLDKGNDTGVWLRNGSNGAQIGNTNVSGRNIIAAGNNGHGVRIEDSDNTTILGNYIGLGADGVTALPNNHGVRTEGTSSATFIGNGTASGRNIISGGFIGVSVGGSGSCFVFGNYIGTDATGTLDRGNSNAGVSLAGGSGEIGGNTSGQGNIISGNSYGIGVSIGGFDILGNFIGTDATGSTAIPNDDRGIRLGVGSGTNIGDGTVNGANVISGNTLDGILVENPSATGNNITGNYIGLQADGVSPLGNGANGILIESDANGNSVTQNIISNNIQNGVKIGEVFFSGIDNNVLSQNSIFNNGGQGILITNGAQNGVALPVITSTVNGLIIGTADPLATIEIFADAADEGEQYLDFTNADGTGNFSHQITVTSINPGLTNITVTQTSSNNTSEFASAPLEYSFVVTNTNDFGTGSLRWVIDNANIVSGADVITFNIPTSDPNYNSTDETWTIQPLTPLPTIVESVDIDAGTQPGTTNRRIIVDGQNTKSLFDINLPLNEDVDISDIRIVNGFSTSPGPALSITAVHNANNRVRLFNCAFINNHSTNDGGAVALLTLVTIFMTDCDFTGNIADNGGGAMVGYGSGLLSAVRCNFMNNHANGGNGGAIYNALTHSLAIERSSFVGNSSSANGGAITINDSSHSLENSTFSGNTATGNGGAIYTDGMFGAISAYFLTIYQNTAATGGGIYLEDGGISFSHCVIADNTGGDYGYNGGSINSSGYNFVGLDPLSEFTNSGDQTNTTIPQDPKLGPLTFSSNTYAHNPLSGSPLIDAGNGSSVSFITEDQRGLARPQDTEVDIGSIEFVPLPALQLTSVTPQANSVNVQTNANLIFDFDNNVDGTTANNTNIIVRGEQTGIITGAFSGGGTSTITFNPTNDFKAGEIIRVTLTSGLLSTIGGLLTPKVSFEFRAATADGLETPDFFADIPANHLTVSQVAETVFATDIDSDGDMDIVGGLQGDQLSWFENNGSQNFLEHVVDNIIGILQVYAADVDSDGDMDLIAQGDDTFNWFENDGSESFTPHVIDDFSPSKSIGQSRPVDLDGDGDLDFVIAYTDFDEVGWHENDGAENFTFISIDNSATATLSIWSVDINGDGFVDVVATYDDNTIAIYYNDGNQNFTQDPIDVLWTDVPVGLTGYAADMDGDGDIDLIFSNNDGRDNVWLENDGLGGFTEHDLVDIIGGERFLMADMDGDADMDILAGKFGEGVFWYENDGSENFTEHQITSVSDWVDVYPVDMDNDGDLDVVATDGGLAWYENTSSSAALVTSVYPTIGATGERVLITGQNLSGVTQVDFNGTNATAFTIINGENIIAIIPPGVTAGPITVTEGGSPYSSAEIFTPALISDGKAANWQEITEGVGGFSEIMMDGDSFGRDVAGAGDINGDGIPDLIVTASSDDTGGNARGAIYVLFMKADRTVESYQKISDSQGNFSGTLADIDQFGISVCGIGDFNGDGVPDIVASSFADDGGLDRGRVYLLYLTSSGTVDSYSIISDTQGNFTGGLSNQNYFGQSIAFLGDMDGDGVSDIAVSADWDAGGGSRRGAVYILFLNANGTVKSHQKIGNGIGGFPAILNNDDFFGRSVANLGDVNGDGIIDLVVTAAGDDTGGNFAGAAYILFMNSNGTVASYTKIAEGVSGFSIDLDAGDTFGNGASQMGDLDLDGIPDVLIGADKDDDGGSDRGALYVLLLNADGTVKYTHKISNDPINSFQGSLTDNGFFGFSASPVGDLDGDGYRDLAIGAYSSGFPHYPGAVWILNIGIAEIELYNGPTNLTSPIADGQATAIDLGTTPIGTDLDKIFAIENKGNAKLNINSISITGTDFSVVAPISTEVLPGGLVNFTVRLSGAAVGTFNATITLDNDDMTESSFDFPITGSVSSVCSLLPTVNAGIDQTICMGSTLLLSGSIGGSATSAMWSTSGTGTFDDNTLLNATYTPDAGDETAGSVVLTLTVAATGACPQVQDQLLLTIPMAFTAGSPSVQSNIGQTTIIDVAAASSINDDDVQSVTITLGALQGTATLNSDNTIGYIPNAGTVGADSFEYQICNQCNLCSTGTVAINILNEPPIITPPTTPITAVAGQSVTINFASLISDINDNIDFNSIQITAGPTSGATVTFDTNFDLTLDYSNTTFAGTDELTIRVCDLLNSCTTAALQIQVDGEITAFNGISPNGDGLNDFFLIQNIQYLEPDNIVKIFNRWGDKVYEMEGYNPDVPEKRFEGKQNNGKELPSGVYFYKVEFTSGKGNMEGYLTIKK